MNPIDEYYVWRQRIPLGNGKYTPGYINLRWDEMHLPDISNKSFLDVGSNDGYIPFEAEKRGAKDVVASDVYTSLEETRRIKSGCPIEGIHLAKQALGSLVEIAPVGVYDLHELNRTFDIVLMSNVIAWLRDPITCVEQLSAVTLETLVIRDGFIRKRLGENFIRYDINDPWIYRPNLTFVETLLKENGFTSVQIIRNKVKTLSERFNDPWCRVKANTTFYSGPSGSEIIEGQDPSGQVLAIANKEGRTLIRSHGWVDSDQVIPLRHTPGLAARMMKTVVGHSMYDKIRTSIYDFNSDLGDFAIVATK